jgi:hypothetical protein
MMQLIHLWDKQTGLVAEDIVDHVGLKGVIDAVFMSHDLSGWVHLESKVCHAVF